MPTAYAYSRWSNKTQGTGDSLRRQLKSCFEWANKHGLELDTSHVDRGVSGYTGLNRIKGALGSFLAKVESGEIERGSYLIVDSLDRLSRESETRVLNMLTNLTLAGIKIVNVAEDHVLDETADMVDYMRVLIHASRSNLESAEKARKISRAHETRKERARETGMAWHSTGPHWLEGEIHGKGRERFVTYTERPDKVRIVRKIFDLIESGIGTPAIAIQLNADGEETPRKGQGWHHSTVLEISRNRCVLGEYQPKFARKGVTASRRPKDGEAVPGYYGKGIIEPDQFHRVQAIIKNRAPTGRKPNVKSFNNLFFGMAVCHVCEGRVGLHATDTKGKWKRFSVLKCNNASRGLCHNKHRYPYQPLEDAVLRYVSEFKIPTSKAEDRFTDSIAKLVGEREEAEHRRLNIMDLAQESGDRAFIAKHAELQARVDELDARLSKLRSDQKEAGAGIPVKARQEALQGLIARLGSVGGEDLYRLRAAISVALRGVIQTIQFDDQILLVMVDPNVIYKFDDGSFTRIDMGWLKAALAGNKPDRLPDGFRVNEIGG